jgi:two-component system CheB/CheR fusion protein
MEQTKSVILPDLIKGLPDGYVLRAWIAACSTGEEAYSLAIAFKEALESTGKHRNLTLQIFATDLDTDARKARRGFFTSNIVVDVSPERISVLQYRSRWLSREFKHTRNAYFAPIMSSKILLY